MKLPGEPGIAAQVPFMHPCTRQGGMGLVACVAFLLMGIGGRANLSAITGIPVGLLECVTVGRVGITGAYLSFT